MIARISLFVAAVLFAGALAAQTGPTRPQDPAIWIEPAPGQQPIRLQSVDIQIHTSGFLARTRIELEFHNPNARVLEGEFVFPLGAGQNVSGYELEVEGRMRQGVVVPKQTARVAFEDISRQQIDPGLAELTRGNVFRTRLYPIPARGNKRVALSFEQVMPIDGDVYRYVLPLAFTQSIGRFSVRAESALAAGTPSDVAASPDAALRFDRSGEAWVASFTRQDIQPQRELSFRIPRATAGGDARTADVLEAADALEPAWRTVVAQVDMGRPATLSVAKKPRRIALFFDASGSASQRDLARERDALKTYLLGLGDVEVVLVAFRNAAEPPRRFSVRNGDASALLDALAELPLDGGSSYGSVDAAVVPDADLALLLGDGLSNFGTHEPALDSGSAPLHVLHAAQRADHSALARIARRAGGRVFSLLDSSAIEVARALAQPDWRLLSTETVSGRCDNVLVAPAVGTQVGLTARCEGRAVLRLRFGQFGGESVQREVPVGVAAPVAGALADSVHRLHAMARIAELETAATPDGEAITALGTRFSVVTRHTSLLVLDRIEDYLRYRIEPKEEDLRAQYRARLPTLPKTVVDEGMAQRLASLAAAWTEFRSWHRTRHPWLETLLLPNAEAEARSWTALESDTNTAVAKRAAAGARQAEDLRRQSAELARRWSVEGADAAQRRRWEREASEVMLRLEQLRDERLVIAPTSAVPAVGDGGGDTLDRIEVTGSRIDREVLAEMAAEPPPPSESAPAPAPVMTTSAGSGSPAPTGEAASRRAREESSSSPRAEPGDAEVAPASIELRAWNPDTPYLAAIRAASDPYAAYLAERKTHADTPAFFVDSADFFRDQAKRPELALRVLSNLAELEVENTALTRVLAYRLSQWNQHALAVGQFEVALVQRGEEPQSYRDLALALARQPQPELARAIELLWKVASGNWHGRFPGIELIALHEINDLLAGADANVMEQIADLGIPTELIDPLVVGLRVVMSWDADNTDIDLWVTDPLGEQTYYAKNRSPSGGHVSRDFTQGYGPEIYTIARPLPGTYRVRANYYSDSRQNLGGPVTLQIEFQTGFGDGEYESQVVTRRLEDGKDSIDVGEFEVGVVR